MGFRVEGFEFIAKPLAEELIEKLGIDRGFLVLGELARCAQVGPADSDFVGIVLRRPGERNTGSDIAEILWNEKGPLTTDATRADNLLRCEQPLIQPIRF